MFKSIKNYMICIVIVFLGSVGCHLDRKYSQNQKSVERQPVSIKVDTDIPLHGWIHLRDDDAWAGMIKFLPDVTFPYRNDSARGFHFLVGWVEDEQPFVRPYIVGINEVESHPSGQGLCISFPTVVIGNNTVIRYELDDLRWPKVWCKSHSAYPVVTIFTDMPQLGIFHALGLPAGANDQPVLESVWPNRKVWVTASNYNDKTKHVEWYGTIIVRWEGASRKPSGPLGKWVWEYEGVDIAEIQLMPSGELSIIKLDELAKKIGFVPKLHIIE